MKQQSAVGILGALARPIDGDWRHDFGDVCSFHSSSALVALIPLSFACAIRNGDFKPLDLFAAGGETHLQFEPIVIGGVRFRPIERDQDWKFGRFGCVECRATHGDGRNGEADPNGPAVRSSRMLV